LGLSKFNVFTSTDKKLSSGDWDDKVQYYDDQSDPPGWYPFTNDLSLMFYDAAVFRLSMAAASISEVMVSAMKSQPNPNQKRSEFIHSAERNAGISLNFQ
jgi:hypothetical protein